MALDPLVQDVTISQVPSLTRDGKLENKMRVVYFIGHHGPFMLDYNKVEYTPERVAADTQEQVDGLIALGAIKRPGM